MTYVIRRTKVSVCHVSVKFSVKCRYFVSEFVIEFSTFKYVFVFLIMVFCQGVVRECIVIIFKPFVFFCVTVFSLWIDSFAGFASVGS